MIQETNYFHTIIFLFQVIVELQQSGDLQAIEVFNKQELPRRILEIIKCQIFSQQDLNQLISVTQESLKYQSLVEFNLQIICQEDEINQESQKQVSYDIIDELDRCQLFHIKNILNALTQDQIKSSFEEYCIQNIGKVQSKLINEQYPMFQVENSDQSQQNEMIQLQLTPIKLPKDYLSQSLQLNHTHKINPQKTNQVFISRVPDIQNNIYSKSLEISLNKDDKTFVSHIALNLENLKSPFLNFTNDLVGQTLIVKLQKDVYYKLNKDDVFYLSTISDYFIVQDMYEDQLDIFQKFQIEKSQQNFDNQLIFPRMKTSLNSNMIDTLDKSVEDIFQIQDHNQIEDPQTQNYDQQERPFIHLKFCGQNKATALVDIQDPDYIKFDIDIIKIGRQQDQHRNDIIFKEKFTKIHGRHCEIQYIKGKGWFIVPVGSQYGTFMLVNNQHQMQNPLKESSENFRLFDGMEIASGGFSFRINMITN
eukprot:403361620